MRTKNKLEDQLDVLIMLSALLEIGFALSVSITIMETKFELSDWQKKLESGTTFYQLLADNKYDKDVLLIIKLGLDSEPFKATINKSIDILKSKIDKRAELIELVKYPIMLLAIGILSIGFVSFFLLPQFEKILNSMGASSQATVILYTIFATGPYIVAGLICLISITTIIIYKLDYEQQLKFLVKFKPIRRIYVSLYNQVFTVTLSNLLKTDLHLSTILNVLQSQEENRLLAAEAQKMLTGLEQGYYLADVVTAIYYDQQLLQILKIGEESGMLIYYLDSYSKIITTINQNRGRKIVFWIQPIFYGVFGILILLLYAAIFIPMFALMDSI